LSGILIFGLFILAYMLAFLVIVRPPFSPSTSLVVISAHYARLKVITFGMKAYHDYEL
jgi:hypothetical protein